MKENKISIEISRPVEQVFEFTLNPKKTRLWIDTILEEESDEFPIQMGTRYSNKDRNGDWTRYKVVALKKNRLFELKQNNGRYHVRYSYEEISEKKTKFTYSEWVDNGELDSPVTISALKNLKGIMEKSK